MFFFRFFFFPILLLLLLTRLDTLNHSFKEKKEEEKRFDLLKQNRIACLFPL